MGNCISRENQVTCGDDLMEGKQGSFLEGEALELVLSDWEGVGRWGWCEHGAY